MSKPFDVKEYADVCEKTTNFFHSFNISVDHNREFYDQIIEFIDKKKGKGFW